MKNHTFGVLTVLHESWYNSINEDPCSPAGRDLRTATTPFVGISVSLQQAAGYSGEGE